MARSNAERSEGEKPHGKFIADFLHKWEEALRDATVAKEMTDTPAWRAMYSARIETYRTQRKSVVDQLAPSLEMLTRTGWDESTEKYVKDLVKDAVESREVHDAFKSTTLLPVIEAVQACDKVISEATYKAEEFERNHGLTAHGIVETLADEIRQIPTVRFDTESGRVVIAERK